MVDFAAIRENRVLSDPIATLDAILAKGTHFFKVKFKKRGTGEIRTMLCRRRVGKYTSGTGVWDRFTEDMRHQVLTVWDVEKFHELRRTGKSEEDAGKGSYRRIPLDAVIEISGVDTAAISPAVVAANAAA